MHLQTEFGHQWTRRVMITRVLVGAFILSTHFCWVPGLIPEPAPSRIPWLQGKDMQAHSNADSSVKVLGLGSEARLPEWGELVSQAVLEVKVGLAGLKHPSCKWTFPQRMIGWRILKTGYFKFRVFFFFFLILVKLKTGISALNTESQKLTFSEKHFPSQPFFLVTPIWTNSKESIKSN